MSEEYRGGHQPDLDGPGIHEAHKVYEGIHENPRWYSTGDEAADAESLAVIRSAKDRPDQMVRIFRAVPHGVTEINPGDWVTPSRSYARDHGMHPTDPSQDWPVISKVVPAKHIVEGSGNSIHEWGYRP